MTNWTLEITTLFVIGSIVCSFYQAEKSRYWLAITHMCFEISLFLNFVVMLVYWSMIHGQTIDQFTGFGRIHMYTVHIVPCIAFLMNWAVTDAVVYNNHRIGLTFVGIAYSFVNYYETQKRGKPLYWFLTWEDFWSPVICVMILVMINVVFSAFNSLSKSLKPHM